MQITRITPYVHFTIINTLKQKTYHFPLNLHQEKQTPVLSSFLSRESWSYLLQTMKRQNWRKRKAEATLKAYLQIKNWAYCSPKHDEIPV